MAFDPLSGTHTVRVPARRNATRIVALRHASRAAARPTGRSRVPRILGAVLVGIGLSTFVAVGLAVVMVTTTVGVLSVGLPDPSQLEALTFSEPTVVYDRTGTVELGRFQREERRVVAFGDVPELVLDATTSAEDRTTGVAIASAHARVAYATTSVSRRELRPQTRPVTAIAGPMMIPTFSAALR